MSLSKDKESIKQQVLNNMKDNGTMNHLQSLYISKIASEIKNTDGYSFLKPYKTFREEKSYIIASQIVIQYFQKKSLDCTLKTISDESEGVINFSNSNLIAENLDIHSDGIWLTDLLNDWNSKKETIIPKNKSIFFDMLQKRLDKVLPKSEKYVRKDISQVLPDAIISQNKSKDSAQSTEANATKRIADKQEEFSKSTKSVESQSSKDSKDLTKSTKSKSSQESEIIFSNDDDSADVPIITDSDDNNLSGNGNNSSKANSATEKSKNNLDNDYEYEKDIDIEIDEKEDSASGGISKPSSTSNAKSTNNKIDESKLAETVSISESNSDEIIDLESVKSSDSFESPMKQTIDSKPQSQTPKPQNSVVTTPQTQTPAKTNLPKPVTPLPDDADFDDIDEELDVIDLDPPNPKQQNQPPKKQEIKTEVPKTQTKATIQATDNNDFDDWSDDDKDIEILNSQSDSAQDQQNLSSQKQETNAETPKEQSNEVVPVDDVDDFDDFDDDISLGNS